MTPLVLVTGANGFVGRRLVASLVERRTRVRCTVRRPLVEGQILRCGETIYTGTLGAETDWSDAVRDVATVIHCAARAHVVDDFARDSLDEYRRVNVAASIALARDALEAGVGRFIYVSSVKVNGEETEPGSAFGPDDAPAPEDAYGISKAEAERALMGMVRGTRMELVIVRPVLVYGPGVRANFASMMRWIQRGVPMPFATVRNARSLLALDNLVDFLIVCCAHPAAAGQRFMVSDGEDLSTPELLQRTAAALGAHARLFSVPERLLRRSMELAGMSALAKRLIGSLRVDISKNERLLHWRPPVSVDEALEQTAKTFLRETGHA